jgi:hypothetical protein
MMAMYGTLAALALPLAPLLAPRPHPASESATTAAAAMIPILLLRMCITLSYPMCILGSTP